MTPTHSPPALSPHSSARAVLHSCPTRPTRHGMARHAASQLHTAPCHSSCARALDAPTHPITPNACVTATYTIARSNTPAPTSLSLNLRPRVLSAGASKAGACCCILPPQALRLVHVSQSAPFYRHSICICSCTQPETPPPASSPPHPFSPAGHDYRCLGQLLLSCAVLVYSTLIVQLLNGPMLPPTCCTQPFSSGPTRSYVAPADLSPVPPDINP